MPDLPEPIAAERIEKLKEIRALGLEPYPDSFHRTHNMAEAATLLKKEEEANEAGKDVVTLGGRMMAMRNMGKIAFADLRDDSGKLQILIRRDSLNDTEKALLKGLDIGDILGATGKLFRTRTGEPTLEASSIKLLTKSLRPLPEKFHGLTDIEMRYRQRYVDLIANPEVKEIMKARSRIVTGIRSFLDGRGFCEVETPVLQPSAGGALARPFITYHNALSQNFFLRIALELHLKRLIVGGFDKVYEIGRVFRNEGIDFKHNPEFTILESYEAYADYQDVMRMVEEMLCEVAATVIGSETLEFNGNKISIKAPFERVDLREMLIKNTGIDFLKTDTLDSLQKAMKTIGAEVDPAKDMGRLFDELISKYVEPKLIQPCFLVDYPIEMSPLAKEKPGTDGRVVERFEGFIGGVEVANAFSELNNPIEQRERFIQQAKMHQHKEGDEEWTIDEDFVEALEYGMPPTGGLGIGIDRLVMLFTGKDSIREVILFPAMKEKG
jgi:lysyl-tRNA synthetase class 2